MPDEAALLMLLLLPFFAKVYRILCKADNLSNAQSLTLPYAYGNIITLHQNSNLSRVAEGTGPMKPSNLHRRVRC